MGEIADEVLSGYRCDTCAQIIDDEEPGFPRNCDDCTAEDEDD